MWVISTGLFSELLAVGPEEVDDAVNNLSARSDLLALLPLDQQELGSPLPGSPA